ncbi:TGc domain-containing protein [Tenacibaculum sp. 190524A02b]|uniref:transglutaminase domain-containing protein n=1 Tax=Tenacibaculum vairaonense TaxID=3137860 RepID=UPI0032B18137
MKKFTFIIFLLGTLKINSQISDFKHINFTRADNIAVLNEGESLNNLPKLVYQLTYQLPSSVEKFRAIYTWVCMNIRNDYSLAQKIIRNRKKLQNTPEVLHKWNSSIAKKVLKKLYKQKKTMCTGYAYLISKMTELVNIESRIINGYGRTIVSNIDTLEQVNHSWNAIKLNNKWYLCDATWSSGYVNENYSFIKDYNDGYFLTAPELFAKNHFPSSKKWLLNASQSNTNFTKEPLVYGTAFKHKIIPIKPLMHSKVIKGSIIHFKLKYLDKTKPESISLITIKNNNQYKLTLKNLTIKNGYISFNYKFNKKGAYDIHLKIDSDYIASYVISSIE